MFFHANLLLFTKINSVIIIDNFKTNMTQCVKETGLQFFLNNNVKTCYIMHQTLCNIIMFYCIFALVIFRLFQYIVQPQMKYYLLRHPTQTKPEMKILLFSPNTNPSCLLTAFFPLRRHSQHWGQTEAARVPAEQKGTWSWWTQPFLPSEVLVRAWILHILTLRPEFTVLHFQNLF